MDVPEPSPTSEVSDRTFRYGLATATIGFACTLTILVSEGVLSLGGALASGLLGGPLFVLAVSVVLARWLGYDKDAKRKSAKFVVYNNNLDSDD